jgi:hypothetical protein
MQPLGVLPQVSVAVECTSDGHSAKRRQMGAAQRDVRWAQRKETSDGHSAKRRQMGKAQRDFRWAQRKETSDGHSAKRLIKVKIKTVIVCLPKNHPRHTKKSTEAAQLTCTASRC